MHKRIMYVFHDSLLFLSRSSRRRRRSCIYVYIERVASARRDVSSAIVLQQWTVL